MNKTVSIIVTGRVQGVFFRKRTAEKARELRISGQVKNEDDGSVSIIASGDADDVDALIAWCHHGPERAEVSAVKVSDAEPVPRGEFRIAR